MATLITIGGGKPLWDTFHIITGRAMQTSWNADMALAMTRCLTVVLDSL